MPPQPPQTPTIAPADPAPADPRFCVGTLRYTRRALLEVMFWMLWGGFSLVIMESLLPALLPLQLRAAGAGDTLIGSLTNSIPSFVGILLNPIVGLQSDNHRGPLGRRRPYLLWCIAPVVVSLALIGLGLSAGTTLQSAATALAGRTISVGAISIGWIALWVVVFVVFNTYVLQAYQFLIADVIPTAVMGRFVGMYRAVGALGGLAFSRWALRFADSHMAGVYAVCALAYAGAFALLIWRVKEGEYPPPPHATHEGIRVKMGRYFSECFGSSFYLNIYVITALFWSAIVPFATFVIFFATVAGKPGYADTLGLTVRDFGEVRGWTFLVQVPVFFAVGPIMDRYHPLRVGFIGLILTAVTYFGCYFFIHDRASLLGWWIANQAAGAIYLGAYLAMLPRLLPADRYGQFFSANQIFGFTGSVTAPIICGLLLERIRDYRFIYAWCGACTLLACLACGVLIRRWNRLGGARNYRPPECGGSSSRLREEASSEAAVPAPS